MMVLFRPKSGLLKSGGDGRESDEINQGLQKYLKGGDLENEVNFPILELETNIIYEILSRLPLRTILACRCVCKTFLNLTKDDPYFIQLHLARTPPVTVNIVLQRFVMGRSCLGFTMFELDQGLKMPSPCSVDCQHSCCQTRKRSSPKRSAELCYLDRTATLVGECNGLVCLYSDSSRESLYVICNIVLGEYVFLPYSPPLASPAYSYFNLSGFGYSKSGEYKIIRFASLTPAPFTSSTAREMVVDILTLGSDSWRRIYDAPCPKIEGSFDPLLNDCLHYITTSQAPAELLCSLDLDSECFTFLPPPSHFTRDYMNRISMINVGVFRGSLCLCYVNDNSHFETWVMKDYGVKESWTKEFSIDIKFYSGLYEVDFYHPLKFLNNGELWLLCSANRLVSFNPSKKTFRDFEALKELYTEVILHYPSFVSLQHTVKGKNLTVMKDDRNRPLMVSLA